MPRLLEPQREIIGIRGGFCVALEQMAEMRIAVTDGVGNGTDVHVFVDVVPHIADGTEQSLLVGGGALDPIDSFLARVLGKIKQGLQQ